jgi:acyl dehydratase
MPIDPSKLLTLEIPDTRQSYGWRECVTYALGVGFGLDPLDERQLRFVDETKLKAVPTMANVLAYPGFWIRDLSTGINWVRAVHGEQAMRVHRPLSANADVVRKTRVVDIVDKGPGRGALLYVEGNITDAKTGERIATLLQTVFCRGDGGFGGSATASHVPHPVPERVPDLSLDMPTHAQLALIYRLSGDRNPLHADPAVARKAGYERPILHGLATYGVACHALMAALCNYEPDRVLALEGRFSTPVFPGETITVDIWRESAGRAAFRARVAARDALVLANGRFDYAA